MICCDRCGEWYHGDCVGISIAEGKRMEKTGKEYICIKCNSKLILMDSLMVLYNTISILKCSLYIMIY